MTRLHASRLAALALALVASGAGAEEPDWSVALAPNRDLAPTGPSLPERLETIRRRVQQALVYPPLARWRAETGEAVVRFEIDAAGEARGVEVVAGSGHAALDRAAARAVVEAAPLPRVVGPLEIPVRFELSARSGPSSGVPRRTGP